MLPEFRLEPLEPIKVKGKTGELKVFAVERTNPAAQAPVPETAVAS